MKTPRASAAMLVVVLSLSAVLSCALTGFAWAAKPDAALPPEAALDLGVLRQAYPGAVLGMERGASGHLELLLADGTRLVYDDGRARTAKEAEVSPDVRTMLAQVYPLGPADELSAHPAAHFDPGRRRVQAFFLFLYGRSEAEVRKTSRSVRFDGHGAPFSTRHGAADALARVWARLEPQLPAHPEWKAVLRPFGGTLCWRNIAATSRLSVHSFGAAVDLNPQLPYWLTERHPEKVPAQVLAFPKEIVAAFEAEGFVWGGKWAEYDMMHFEYRPELVLKARVLRGEARLAQ